MSNAIEILGRGGPIQTAHVGSYTCTQNICSKEGCVYNGVTFRCISGNVKPSYDISFLGRTMRCDATDKSAYPWLLCDCEWDPVKCLDSGGVKTQFGPPSTSVAGLNDYVADTTVIGGAAKTSSTKSSTAPPMPTNTPGAIGSGGTSSVGSTNAANKPDARRIGTIKMIWLAFCLSAVLVF